MSGKAPKSGDGSAPAKTDDSPRSHAPAHLPHFLDDFLDKLKRRNVGRVAILYTVVCYLILEPFEMFFHLLDLPVWTGRTAVALMVLGFPVALLLAWINEITPTGIKPSTEVDPHQSIARQTGRKLDRAIIAVLTVALVYFVADKFYISKRVAVVSPAAEVAAPAAVSAPAASVIPEKSVAVLPFVDMSEKKDQEYFSDGLSEELIDMLTRVPELRVPARTSSFYFKGKQVTIADIAKALGVVHVLEGSVRKSGNTLRVTAQLIRVDNGYHVWSETYDRKLDDIFKIQDEIADAVVAALKVRLLPAQQPSARNEQHTENLEAYNLYLQGRQSYNQGDTAGYQSAVTAFRAAAALDPHYAAAYADLALAQFWLTDDTYSGGPADAAGYESALAAAEKAVALAPELAAGYSARGFLRAVYKFDFAGAQVDLDKALALSPGDALAQH